MIPCFWGCFIFRCDPFVDTITHPSLKRSLNSSEHFIFDVAKVNNYLPNSKVSFKNIIFISSTFVFLLLSFVLISRMLPPRQSHPLMCPTRPCILCLQHVQIVSEITADYFLACGVRYAAQNFNLSLNSLRFRSMNRNIILNIIPQRQKIRILKF
jgi:hypothetical protein